MTGGEISQVGKATLRTYAKGERGKLALSPLMGWAILAKGIFFRGLPPISPRDCVRIAQDEGEKHGPDIGGESGKGHGGAYKRRITYQVRDRGETLQREGVMPSHLIQSYHAHGKGGERARDMATSYQRGPVSADPHPTRLHPHLRLRAAARWEK